MPKRLKLFLWGPEGTGKTIMSLKFPSPVVIDMERGSDLYGEDFDFSVLKTTTADGVTDAIDWLATNKHDYRTVVIDPITVYWQELQNKWSNIFLARNKSGKGFKFDFYNMQFPDWKIIKAENNDFLRKLSRLDMNIIVTAHAKDQFSDGGGIQKTGTTHDSEKNLGYFFDTVIQTYRKGEKFMGQRMKDRTNILKKEHFELNYDVFKKGMGDSIEKDVETVLLMDEAQKNTITNHIATLDIPLGSITRMLDKYECENIDDLTRENADEIIVKFKGLEEKRKEKQNA